MAYRSAQEDLRFILANVAFSLQRPDIRSVVEGPLKELLAGLK